MSEVIKDYSLEEVEKLLAFIRQNYKTLAEEADRKAFKDILTNLETAKTMADDLRRRVCLMDAATKFANQLAFRLFVEDSLDDATLKMFREFETVKQVSGEAEKVSAADRARAEEITKLQQEYMAERQPFEIFQAVIGGMTKEEAEQKQAEYNERKQAALAQAQGA